MKKILLIFLINIIAINSSNNNQNKDKKNNDIRKNKDNALDNFLKSKRKGTKRKYREVNPRYNPYDKDNN